MAEPRGPLPIAFRAEKRLSSARTARAVPSSHPAREKAEVLGVHETILEPAVKGLSSRAASSNASAPTASVIPYVYAEEKGLSLTL